MDSLKKSQRGRLGYIFREYNTIFILVALIVVSSIMSDSFFTVRNIINLLSQLASPIVIALGMLFVILIGGIDLSVGSVAAVGAVCVALFLGSMPLLPAILLTLLIGLAIGLVTGLLVAYAKVAPFIATLAMQTIGTGIAFIVSNGTPIIPATNELEVMGTLKLGEVPLLVIIAFAIVALMFFIQKYTPYGRIIMASGSNETVVHLAGIRVKRYKASVFVLSGAFAVFGGIMIAARTGIGSPQVGTGMELDAIAAAVIGGASLNGGRGTVIKTLAGAIILGLIGNIMNLMGVPSYPQSIVKGVVIVLAVLLQGVREGARNE